MADRSTGVAQAALFIRRYGDPLGRLDAGIASSTEDWAPLATALDEIAQAWEPAGPDGISVLTIDRSRQELAEDALRRLAPPDEGLAEVRLVARGLELVSHARTLGGYMAASAASMLARGASMKRCEHCSDWYAPNRTDARFCAPTCKAVHSRQAIAAGPDARPKTVKAGPDFLPKVVVAGPNMPKAAVACPPLPKAKKSKRKKATKKGRSHGKRA